MLVQVRSIEKLIAKFKKGMQERANSRSARQQAPKGYAPSQPAGYGAAMPPQYGGYAAGAGPAVDAYGAYGGGYPAHGGNGRLPPAPPMRAPY